MSDDTKKALLSPNSRVTLGAAATVLTTALAAYVWLDNRLDTIEGGIAMSNIAITNLINSQWSLADQKEFALRLKLLNLNLTVPDVNEIVSGRVKQNKNSN